MKSYLFSKLTIVVFFGITLLNVRPITYPAGETSPALKSASVKDYVFDIGSAYGDRDNFNIKVSEAGCILAKIEPWSRSGTSGSAASQLALILNGSDRTGYYNRADGSATNLAPLWISYGVSEGKAKQVSTWTISVINFTRSGTAHGTVHIEYPPTTIPCELKSLPARTKGQIDLSWNYAGKSFAGSFLVERRNDRGGWDMVSACRKTSTLTRTPITTPTTYSCSDTRLVSGREYYYRACIVTSGSACGSTNVTPAIKARAP